MLACDLVVAADHVRFALPEAARGLVPGAGGTLPLLRIPLAVELANQVAMNRPWAVRRTCVLLAATEELPVSQLWERIDEVVAEARAGLDARECARASLERWWPSAEA